MFHNAMEDTMHWNEADRLTNKRSDDCMQCFLTDDEWAVMEPLTPRKGLGGRPA